MAAGVWTGSTAAPYRLDRASSGENQRPQKSATVLALVGSIDTAPTALTTGYIQASSTFDCGNNPGACVKLVWTYGVAATILTVALKASVDNGTNDPFDWVEDYGSATSGVYTPSVFSAILTKGTFDITSPAVARMAVPYQDRRRRFFQVWAKVDNAGATNTLAGWVGGACST